MPFKRMKKLSEVFIKKIDKIEVDANKCTKVRSVLSQCQACLEVCPTNSIKIIQDEIQLEPCLDCGLCTAVCPTNALRWNHPPIIQLYNQWLNQSRKKFVLTCAKLADQYRNAEINTVPCLGMIPSELWKALAYDLSDIQILCSEEICHTCKITEGYEQLQKELAKANVLDGAIQFSTEVSDASEEIDHDRRRMLSALFSEVKETNTIALKEMLEVNQSKSPFEKFDHYVEEQNKISEMVDEVHAMKISVLDKLLNDTLIHTDKREILLNLLKKDAKLESETEVLLPKVYESCTLCGACAFLCPTDALYIDEESLIIAPSKCVACHLCVEICWEKHIELKPRKSTIFQEIYVFLYKK